MSEKKLGRPKLFSDEEAVRVSLRLRPRYKEAIELIAKHRQTSINEAIEYCIIDAASHYEIDDNRIINFVRSETEVFSILHEANLSLNWVLDSERPLSPNEVDESVISGNSYLLNNYINEYRKIPYSLNSPLKAYIVGIIKEPQLGIAQCFNFDRLLLSLEYLWRENYPQRIVTNAIKKLYDLYFKTGFSTLVVFQDESSGEIELIGDMREAEKRFLGKKVQ